MCNKMFTKRGPKDSPRKILLNIDYEELDRLKDDPSSFIKLVKCDHHLSLHPYHLANVKKSINEKLSNEICSYNKKLSGIILGSRNVRVLDSAAPINADMCFVHVDVEVEFFVFTPAVDQVHKGIVNKKFRGQLNCLVHGIFNVSLPKPDDGEEEWLGANTQVGQEIEFRITYIDLEGPLPYIRGELVSIISEDSGVSTGEEQLETPKLTKKNNAAKRMKKRKLSESLDESFDENPPKKRKSVKATTDDEEEHIDQENENESKRKSKKAKTKDEEEYFDQESENESKRKSKKAKTKDEEEYFDQESETDVPLPSKKNKKTGKKKSINESPVANEVHIKQEIESEVESPKRVKKTKVKKSKAQKDENDDDDTQETISEHKSKKTKKKHSPEKSIDLNLTSLYDEMKDLDVANSVKVEVGDETAGDSVTEWSSRVIKLPPDSDLDEVLKDLDVKPKKKKEGKKRRASVFADSDDDFVKPAKKMKRKSN